MRASLNETKLIDDYILARMEPSDALVVQARMTIDPGFCAKIEMQRKVHFLVRLHGRQQLKSALAGIHDSLFGDGEKDIFQK